MNEAYVIEYIIENTLDGAPVCDHDFSHATPLPDRTRGLHALCHCAKCGALVVARKSSFHRVH